jgi:hypothetical protein
MKNLPIVIVSETDPAAFQESCKEYVDARCILHAVICQSTTSDCSMLRFNAVFENPFYLPSRPENKSSDKAEPKKPVEQKQEPIPAARKNKKRKPYVLSAEQKKKLRERCAKMRQRKKELGLIK